MKMPILPQVSLKLALAPITLAVVKNPCSTSVVGHFPSPLVLCVHQAVSISLSCNSHHLLAVSMLQLIHSRVYFSMMQAYGVPGRALQAVMLHACVLCRGRRMTALSVSCEVISFSSMTVLLDAHNSCCVADLRNMHICLLYMVLTMIVMLQALVTCWQGHCSEKSTTLK